MSKLFLGQLKQPKNWTVREQRLKKVLKEIIDNPEFHDQSNWHCGTSHCFAGTGQLIARKKSIRTYVGGTDDEYAVKTLCKLAKVDIVDGNSCGIGWFDASNDSRVWLGLTYDEADRLFSGSNTLADLNRIVKNLCSLPERKEMSLAKYLEQDDIEV